MEPGQGLDKTITRRDFLKGAGILAVGTAAKIIYDNYPFLRKLAEGGKGKLEKMLGVGEDIVKLSALPVKTDEEMKSKISQIEPVFPQIKTEFVKIPTAVNTRSGVVTLTINDSEYVSRIVKKTNQDGTTMDRVEFVNTADGSFLPDGIINGTREVLWTAAMLTARKTNSDTVNLFLRTEIQDANRDRRPGQLELLNGNHGDHLVFAESRKQYFQAAVTEKNLRDLFLPSSQAMPIWQKK